MSISALTEDELDDNRWFANTVESVNSGKKCPQVVPLLTGFTVYPQIVCWSPFLYVDNIQLVLIRTTWTSSNYFIYPSHHQTKGNSLKAFRFLFLLSICFCFSSHNKHLPIITTNNNKTRESAASVAPNQITLKIIC